MKRITLILLCAVLMSISAYAQTVTAAQVPGPVKKSLITKFPKATDVEWEKVAANYQAQFTNGNDWTVALFSATGEWQKTEISLDTEMLPATLKTSISKNFKGFETTSATKIINKGGTNYLVQVDSETEGYEVLIKEDGTVVKKTKVEYIEEDYEESESEDY